MKNRISVLIVCAMLLALLAACSSSTSGDPAGKGAEATAVKPSKDPVDLTFYTTSNNVAEETFNAQYGNKIREKFPNINVKYVMQKDSKTLPDMLTAGQGIDILMSSIGLTANFLLQYDLQYDISELIKASKYDLSKLEPSTVDIQRQLANGGMYGLPIFTTSAALFYNKDIFDKFGVAYPKSGMTWDELYELTKKMTRMEGGVQYKGLTMAYQHMMFLNQISAEPIDSKTLKSKFTDESMKRIFENYARFYKIPGNELPKNKFLLAGQQDPFSKDKTVSMLLTLSGAGRGYKDMNWDVVQLPYYSDKIGVGPQSYPTYFYITKTNKAKTEAFAVLDYLTSPEFQQFQADTQGAFTVLKDNKTNESLGKSIPEYAGKNVKDLLPGKFAPPTVKSRYQAVADKELIAALEAYVSGTDVNTALREAGERVDKAIAAETGK